MSVLSGNIEATGDQDNLEAGGDRRQIEDRIGEKMDYVDVEKGQMSFFEKVDYEKQRNGVRARRREG